MIRAISSITGVEPGAEPDLVGEGGDVLWKDSDEQLSYSNVEIGEGGVFDELDNRCFPGPKRKKHQNPQNR